MLSEEVEGAEVGWYVRLHMRGVGTQLYEALQGSSHSRILAKINFSTKQKGFRFLSNFRFFTYMNFVV